MRPDRFLVSIVLSLYESYLSNPGIHSLLLMHFICGNVRSSKESMLNIIPLLSSIVEELNKGGCPVNVPGEGLHRSLNTYRLRLSEPMKIFIRGLTEL